MVDVVDTIVFPPSGIKNPETGKKYFKDRLNKRKEIGKVIYSGYFFKHDWEIVPGTWIMQIWYQEKKVSEIISNIMENP